MLVGGHRLDECVEEDLHSRGRHLGQDQRERLIRARADSAKQIGKGEAVVGEAGWALSARIPAMADAALLADACLILEPHRNALAFMCIGNLFQNARGSF